MVGSTSFIETQKQHLTELTVVVAVQVLGPILRKVAHLLLCCRKGCQRGKSTGGKKCCRNGCTSGKDCYSGRRGYGFSVVSGHKKHAIILKTRADSRADCRKVGHCFSHCILSVYMGAHENFIPTFNQLADCRHF